MNEEILPKVVKLRPRIEEKLDLDAILGENTEEGQNPDWSDMFSGFGGDVQDHGGAYQPSDGGL
ncbi:MAG: hypothetical protein MZV63_02080 [Marinilabiliales bacterium]|nr:hypothetical protein [Marinilabiliales bacterium]